MRRVANMKLNAKALESSGVEPIKLTPRKKHKQPTTTQFPTWHQADSPDMPTFAKPPPPKFSF
jgi:hypothetical protein